MHKRPPAFAVTFSYLSLVRQAIRIPMPITCGWKQLAVPVELRCIRTVHPVLLNRARHTKAFRSFE